MSLKVLVFWPAFLIVLFVLFGRVVPMARHTSHAITHVLAANPR